MTSTEMKKDLVKHAYNIINPIRRLYWFCVRPHTRGVKCIVEYNEKILLVKLSYAYKGWTLPGGGVKRNETFEEAAKRELWEEAGIEATNLKKIYEYKTIQEYKNDTVGIFYAKRDNPDYKVDGVEITDAQWFDVRDSIPKPHGRSLSELIDFFRAVKEKEGGEVLMQ